MNLRPYIAVILALIIFGKLIALDSNILGQVLNSNQISYVKIKCDNNSQENSQDGEVNEAEDGIKIAFHSFCNSVFQLDKPVLEIVLIALESKKDFGHIIAETKEFNYIFIPPPKLS